MRNRWIGLVFTLLFLLFLVFAARKSAAPLLDVHLFQLESKLIYIILASVVVGGLLLFLLVVFFPPWAYSEHRLPVSTLAASPKHLKLLEGQAALELGDRHQGLQLLGSIEEKDPSYGFARKYMGDVLAANGDWSEAAAEYRKALKHATGTERALMYLSLGNVYESQDAFEEARDLYKQGFQESPRSLELVSRLRALAVRNGDWRDAMLWQDKLEQEFPKDSETPEEANWKIGIRYELARDACRSGSFKTSQALLKYIFRLTDYFAPAHLLQGEIQELQQNALAAFRAYEEGFRMTQNPALLKKISEILLLQNQPGKAIEFLREVTRANAGDPRTAFCLGDLYRKLEMTDEAKKIFESIRHRHPDWVLNNSALAELYYRTGQHERSLQIYRNIVDGAESLSALPWQCYNCNTTFTEYAGFCMVCTMWNSINLNQNKAGMSDFGYEKSSALPL